MISLLLHESEVKPRMNVNNKPVITQVHLYDIFVINTHGYVHLRIKASFVTNNLFLE